MEKYYKERAPIYDKVYLYPEREKDIKFLKEYIPSRFKGLDIIEIAAGTGYWTQYVSATAKTILATDAVEEPLEELKRRRLPDSVSIVKQDAYSLDSIDQLFNGAVMLNKSLLPRNSLSCTSKCSPRKSISCRP
ncbi:class I SAM-dependent methyltransferase [Gammaproteobacteria bacterium AH-315-E17]|nr:class I SAM-dependent methyltransferase [Gammaproteobacteria bacterium AH-315-E17]